MKNLWMIFALLMTTQTLASDIKISALPLGSAATSGISDSFPYVSAAVNITKRLTLFDIVNIPTVQTALGGKLTTTLTDGNIWIGNSSNLATSRTLSGDVLISDLGVSTIQPGVVTNAKVASGAAIAFSKLATLTATNILVGNASNVATSVAMSGDATLSNVGALTIANGAVTNAKVASNAAIDFSKLASLASTNILVGNGSNVATSVAMSGDGTLSNAGALTIANSAVSNAKLANMSNNTIKGNVSGISAAPGDLNATQATAMLNSFVGDSGSGGTKGLVPAPASGDAAASKFLKADGTWTTISAGTLTVAAKSSNYTLTSTDGLVTANAAGGAFTLTLPANSSNSGKVYYIKKTDSSANAVTIARAGSDTIDGATSRTITVQYESIILVSDGAGAWDVF